MRSLGKIARDVPTHFWEPSDRTWTHNAMRALLSCLAMIGFGLSPLAVAQTTVTYIHTDALGSVIAESDANGSVIKRYHYEPYGALVDGQGVQ